MHHTLSLLFFSFLFLFSGCGSSDSKSTNSADIPLFGLYWSSYSGVEENTTVQHGIYGADLDLLSSSAKIIRLTNNLSVAAVDATGNLYWAANVDDNSSMAIFTSDKYGNYTKELISGFTSINGLSIDNTQERIYYSVDGTDVGYSDFNGTNPQTIINSLTSATHLYIDTVNNELYISQNGNISKSDMEGAGLTTVVASTRPEQVGIDHVNNKLVWADTSTDIISRSNLDGSNIETLLDFSSSDANPNALVVDATNSKLLYVINGTELQSSGLAGEDNTTVNAALSPNVTSLWIAK